MSPPAPLEFPRLWDGALTFEQFMATTGEKYRPLWEGIYRHAKAPEWAATALDGRKLHLLAIIEEWCIDTSSTTPFLQRLAETVPGIELRILLRDRNLDVMDHYLTNGGRAIPVVIVLDEAFRELGHWGPRPAELQAWVTENKGVVTSAEKVKHTRSWYARDQGDTTVRELLEAIREP